MSDQRRDGTSTGDYRAVWLFLIMIIILAVLALIVVKALAESRGVFSPFAQPYRLRCLWVSTALYPSGACG